MIKEELIKNQFPNDEFLQSVVLQIVDKCIAELEKENEELRNNGFTVSAMTERQLKVALKKGELLERENAELKKKLKEKLKTIADNDLSFVAKFDALEKENTKLKEELKDWKDEWQEQVQKANEEGYARTLQTMQLSKAKEIIKQLMYASRDCIAWYCLCDKANKFIKELEK